MTDEEKRERRRRWSADHRAKVKAERNGESGRRLRASHLCADPGPAIAEPDWRPRSVKGNPEEIMRAPFQGRSYAPVPPPGGAREGLTP
jgi:hypothetical protein